MRIKRPKKACLTQISDDVDTTGPHRRYPFGKGDMKQRENHQFRTKNLKLSNNFSFNSAWRQPLDGILNISTSDGRNSQAATFAITISFSL